ncbi:hypothetical protein ALC56_13237 [Trachymyrmex septentrionalis]|uniref:Uncharacterized protein n=1 Tax=Trachymyrmex septentrionalis TaxID=34720 RepID=A0A195EVU0_9HYME|nr:hypothetical protein ALC56_13237 [Trachymyrmex septentrionalis]
MKGEGEEGGENLKNPKGIRVVTGNPRDQRSMGLKRSEDRRGFAGSGGSQGFVRVQYMSFYKLYVIQPVAGGVKRGTKQVRSSVRRKILTGSAALVNIKLYLDIFNELAESGFLEIFSNLAIALWILLTAPITMTQTRSCDLAMISIEKELANSLDYVVTPPSLALP